MIELSIRLNEDEATAIRRRATETGHSVDEYLIGLAKEDERRSLDNLAAEGYRLLSEETGEFAEAALPVARETWPQWEAQSPRPSHNTRITCRDEILSVVRSLLQSRSGKEFGVQEVIDEMYHRGTTYSESTIRTHITSRMCANAPDNHATVYSDLERVGRGLYRLRGEA